MTQPPVNFDSVNLFSREFRERLNELAERATGRKSDEADPPEPPWTDRSGDGAWMIVTAIERDYLMCKFWRGTDSFGQQDIGSAIPVAKPYGILIGESAGIVRRQWVDHLSSATFTIIDNQTVDVEFTDDVVGSVTERWTTIPAYRTTDFRQSLILVQAMPTEIEDADSKRIPLVDANVDARKWTCTQITK